MKALECKSTMPPFCLLDETWQQRRKEDEKRRIKQKGGFWREDEVLIKALLRF